MSENSVYEVANQWRARGVSPIPCQAQSKIAAISWKPYQDTLPSAEQIRDWFSNERNYNLAVIGGGRKNLAILDFDTMPRYEEWSADRQELARSYTVQTARGRHVYFFLDSPASTQYLNGIELRSTGAYVLTPPSVHPSGANYIAVNPEAAILTTNLDAIVSVECAQYMRSGTTAPLRPLNTEQGSGDNLTAEIRRALPMLSLVLRYTTATPSSSDGRWFLASCPFKSNHKHGDAHPSFWIDNRRGIAGCFSPRCKAEQPNARPMDQINFYARLHGLSNRDAIFALADECGLFNPLVVTSIA